MRLIDADKVLDGVINPYERISISRWLDDAPTVDAVPVRRGKWILQGDRRKKLYGWYFCSECGACIGGKTNFCSECGADMRGRQDG